MAKIRILVADDHALIRQGTVGLLNAQGDMEVIGEAGNGEEAIKQCAAVTPNVVLMDIGMPGTDGLSATKEISTRFPNTQVLILTIHDREDYLFQALRAGASGYIMKGADVQDLLSAIRCVFQGQVYLYPTIAKKFVAYYLRSVEKGENNAAYNGLTERERQVLRMVAAGRTVTEIAEALFLSPNTVQTHRDHIMAKLNLHRKADLIRYAIQKGFADVDA